MSSERARGSQFFKMTGSGNDFVVFDARDDALKELETAEGVRRVCARGTGVGADGAVFLVRSGVADVGLRYYNADGSRAALCGNATLCTVQIGSALGIRRDSDGAMRIETDSGVVAGRVVDGLPEFDLGVVERIELAPPISVGPGERRIGFAVAGVPHLVVLVDDTEAVDVVGRGRVLRHEPWAGLVGANVNFVAARRDGSWAMRTYERGVEGETLACGTGAVASAAVLTAWLAAPSNRPVRLWTRSGAPLDVTRRSALDGGPPIYSLRGEGRLVFEGQLLE